jgi:hypothetical protein
MAVSRPVARPYTVSDRVILPAPGTGSPLPGATLIARFQGFRRAAISQFRAYTLSQSTRGSIISARIDGVPEATVTNRMYRNGPAGLGSLGYYATRYPNFTVRSLPAA